MKSSNKGLTFTRLEKFLSRHDVKGRVVVIDCVTLWATNFFFDLQTESLKSAKADAMHVENTLLLLKDEFLRFTSQDATFIFVTNEIGSGGVSDNSIQRKFTDVEGWMNQYIAERADKVILMVSGIPITIKDDEV